ncbi:hypothetical protein GCM10010344_63790 [Streptomyces bluensis]|nr:hypothetical protein GCM10010344_63790 [Streptomyces bluensis]
MAAAGINCPRVLVEEPSDRRLLGGHIHPAHLSVPRTAVIGPKLRVSRTLARPEIRAQAKTANRRCSTPQAPTAARLDELDA